METSALIGGNGAAEVSAALFAQIVAEPNQDLVASMPAGVPVAQVLIAMSLTVLLMSALLIGLTSQKIQKTAEGGTLVTQVVVTALALKSKVKAPRQSMGC
jgi:hypothetical protein